MQRLGGGGYTRKTKRGGGVVGGLGPTNPSCGCDMQAGWPKFLTENIPLPGQSGGGSCGIPPIPNYYNGRGLNQHGGSCPCSGGVVPQPFQSGGGQPTVYNSNPVPDACPFPGTGYCGFYARGGANARPRRQLTENQKARLRAGRLLASLRRQREINAVVAGSQVSSVENNPPPFYNNSNSPGTHTDSNDPQPHKGGANYGEPMYLQARLRGGKQRGGGCGCLKGGYKPTKKNLNALKRWRKGESIGFTMTSSLKAKGLIPRTSRKHRGKKIVSAKYR